MVKNLKKNLGKIILAGAVISSFAMSTRFLLKGFPEGCKAKTNSLSVTLLYDKNNDGNPDYAMDCGFAGPTPGLAAYYWKRKPTQEEINWYKKD